MELTSTRPIPDQNDDLRSEVIEQVMRCVDDDAAIVPFLTPEPGSRSAAAALGRVLGDHAVPLRCGCPILAFVAGVPLDSAWREWYPPAATSLYSQLDFLSALYGSPDIAELGPYDRLEQLRAQADAELS